MLFCHMVQNSIMHASMNTHAHILTLSSPTKPILVTNNDETNKKYQLFCNTGDDTGAVPWCSATVD